MTQEVVQRMENMVEEMLSDLHTAMPGKILEYDPVEGLAMVEPSTSFLTGDGRKIPYPAISGVPVVMPRGAGCEIAFPVKPGDPCMILVSECDISPAMGKGEEDISMRFDMTNAMAFPGIFALPESGAAARAQEEEAVVLKNGETEIMLKDGAVEAAVGDGIKFLAEGGKITVKSENVRIQSDEISIEGNVSINGGISATGTISTPAHFKGNLMGAVIGGGG